LTRPRRNQDALAVETNIKLSKKSNLEHRSLRGRKYRIEEKMWGR
jgi:hypothetical protein